MLIPVCIYDVYTLQLNAFCTKQISQLALESVCCCYAAEGVGYRYRLTYRTRNVGDLAVDMDRLTSNLFTRSIMLFYVIYTVIESAQCIRYLG